MRPDPEAELRARMRAPAEPEETAAARRAWAVVQGAAPVRRRGPVVGWRVALSLTALVVVALTLALAPPRDALADLLRRAVGVAAPRSAPSPAAPDSRLPGGGRLLLAGRGGAVVVGGGRSRLSGAVDEAGWSARGHFVVTARGAELIAVDARGERRWSLVPPGGERVHGVAWDTRDGYRIAYLAGGDARSPAALRVVNGDGSGDRRAGSALAFVTPAWRPRTRHALGWVTAGGDVVLADLDRRIVRWRRSARSRRLGRVAALTWSDDGTRLLVVGARGTLLLSGDSGAVLRRTSAPVGTRNVAAAFAPGGAQRYALTRRAPGGRARVLVWARHPGRTLLEVDGRLSAPHWSPDGQWLAVASGRSDALLLLQPRHGRLGALRTIPDLRRRFGAGRFPRLEGWCCPR